MSADFHSGLDVCGACKNSGPAYVPAVNPISVKSVPELLAIVILPSKTEPFDFEVPSENSSK